MGRCRQIRSFLYIDDVLRVQIYYLKVITEIINIGNDKHVTINELVSILGKLPTKS